MKIYAEIRKNRVTAVRVTRDQFRGQERLDVREYFDPGDGLRPTKKGVNVSVRDLPALRAALEAAEADCLSRGLLEVEDYENVGLPLPAELRGAA